MNMLSLIVAETVCPECEGQAFRQTAGGLEVCDTCYGVGSVKAGPAIPPTCAMCAVPLKWSGRDGYHPCTHHPRARVVYYLQESQAGYPAGWPLCRCGEPTMSGKATCGQYTCNTALAQAGAPSPQKRKP